MDPRPSPGDAAPFEDAVRPIVVGVGSDGRSMSAVMWATEEAERTGHGLRLVTARNHDLALRGDDEPLRNDLAGLARRLTLVDLEHQVRVGSPADVLLEAAADSAFVVLGRRGLGAFHRRLVGGTSVAVATLSPVPVVVVPEAWIQPSFCSRPVVLGLEPHDITELREIGAPETHGDVIDFAFERAEYLGVPLHVVSAWGVPPAFMRNAKAIAACRERFATDLQDRLRPWRQAFPGVDVQADSVAAAALPALLEAELPAQLTVVGRHAGHHMPGGALGATPRALVQRSRRPVAVVPVPDAMPPHRRFDPTNEKEPS